MLSNCKQEPMGSTHYKMQTKRFLYFDEDSIFWSADISHMFFLVFWRSLSYFSLGVIYIPIKEMSFWELDKCLIETVFSLIPLMWIIIWPFALVNIRFQFWVSMFFWFCEFFHFGGRNLTNTRMAATLTQYFLLLGMRSTSL